MRKKPDDDVENPRHDEEATGAVLRLVPRAERERQANRTSGQRATGHVQTPARDGDDDDPGPAAA